MSRYLRRGVETVICKDGGGRSRSVNRDSTPFQAPMVATGSRNFIFSCLGCFFFLVAYLHCLLILINDRLRTARILKGSRLSTTGQTDLLKSTFYLYIYVELCIY